MKNSLKLWVLILTMATQTACLDLLLSTTGMLGGNLGASSEAPSLIDPDSEEQGLMSDGPLPLPVTMSKLDGIDATRLVITSEPYAVAQIGFLRSARADTETCVAGEECLITVSGLSGAVRAPETTPYVLIYADDDNSVFVAAQSDGSFDAVDLILTLDETDGKTDEVLIAGMTDDDLTEGFSTYPLYFVVTDSGVVEFAQTNTDGELVDGVMASDEEGNTYYALTSADDTTDVWRQDEAGGTPQLILQNASGTIIDISIIDANTILVFFESGSAQLVEIEEGGAKATPLVDIFRHALAQENAGRTVDGLLIRDPVEIFDFSGYDFESASFLPYDATGFIINLAPADGSSTEFLAAYVSLDGEDVRPLIPYDTQNSDNPFQASLSLVDGYFYVVAEVVNDNPMPPFIGDTNTQFSRIPVTDDLDETFTDAWENREVLFDNSTTETIDVDIRNGVLVFSDVSELGTVRIFQWTDSQINALQMIWYESDLFTELMGLDADRSSVTDHSVTLSGGVVMAPNGAFFLACAFAEAPEGDTSDPDYLEALSKGAHIFAHRIDEDETGEFHKILDSVAVESCPDGMEITDDYLLRYFSLGSENVPSQLSFIDLKTIPLFDGLTQ